MKRKKVISNLKLVVLFTIYYLLFIASPKAYAEQGIQTNPRTVYITTDVPANISAPVSIKNQSSKEEEIFFRIEPFITDPFGKVVYQSNFAQSANKSIGNHIKLFDADKQIEKSFILSPNERKTLDLRIELTENQSLSDYYFSMLFITKNRNDVLGSSTLLQVGTAVNVLLSIGDKDTKGSLEDFSAPLITDQGPVMFNLNIKNNGEHLFMAKGYILVTNMFGQTIGKLDLPDMYVLSKSNRTIPEEWKENLKLGLYKADLYLSYFPNTKVNHSTIRFIALPLKAFIITLVLIVLALIVVSRSKLYRK